jgi:hypothetical protein
MEAALFQDEHGGTWIPLVLGYSSTLLKLVLSLLTRHLFSYPGTLSAFLLTRICRSLAMPFGKAKAVKLVQTAEGNGDALATAFLDVGTSYVALEDTLHASLPERVKPEAVEPRIQVRGKMSATVCVCLARADLRHCVVFPRSSLTRSKDRRPRSCRRHTRTVLLRAWRTFVLPSRAWTWMTFTPSFALCRKRRCRPRKPIRQKT